MKRIFYYQTKTECRYKIDKKYKNSYDKYNDGVGIINHQNGNYFIACYLQLNFNDNFEN